MRQNISIITPTHARDIEQFSLLRRSITLFAPEIAHTAIVNTEDCAAFSARFRNEKHLQIVASADVLPRAVEQRRRKSGPRWLTGRYRHPRTRLIKGWHAQQLMKIFALAASAYEAAVFVDSDVFVCRPLSADYFYQDGRLKLFRRRALDAESLDFDISTHEILGNPLHKVTELYDYIFSPSCFRRSTAQSLLAEFNRRHRSTWVRRFLEQRRPSEYNLLGYAATVLEGGAGYQLIECNPDELHHSIRFPEDRARLENEIVQMQTHPKGFVLIQSSLRVQFEQIARAFELVAQAHQVPPGAVPAVRP
jgi:hypothetical protein